MLNNWLRPISNQLIKGVNELSKDRIGKNILLFKNEFPNLKKAKIAIIGIDDSDADKVRESFYKLSFPFQKLEIADLGNIRKKDHSFVIPVIEELVSSGIFPVIIGKNADLIIAQYLAYLSKGQFVNLACIDETIHYSFDSEKTVLNQIVDKKDSHLFNLSLIGFQSHFVSPKVIAAFEEKNYDCIRLGKARSALDQLEPIIRDADLLSFNLASLKQSDAPGVIDASPNGFFAEEACQLSRYAGMSEKLSSIGFYGFDRKLDQNNQTAQVTAQLIWYFLDGYYGRKNDFPVSSKSLVEYIVESKENGLQLRFWKSSKSGRWWLQVPAKTKKNLKRHKLVPCSYNDYQLACREEIPDRLLSAFKRFV
jgi:formiminoglutamase